ncbi:hypothetical protein Cgig2_024046 [Carnegiea gigantea]|uniref:arginine--tRNA ligase n=1 Tax=Carnegiea gigantea TaxID=171969 RepID=A0A9Q1KKS2_9CARY|nr:hypothetical protein Cgig2_024046 [Carnegiea gigantea]
MKRNSEAQRGKNPSRGGAVVGRERKRERRAGRGMRSILLTPSTPPHGLSLHSHSFLRSSPSLSASGFLRNTTRKLISATKIRALFTMATEEGAGNVKRQLAKVFEKSIGETVPSEVGVQPLIAASPPNFGDYQCNNAMAIFSKIKGKNSEFRNPRSLGEAIMKNLPQSDMIESCSVAGPGFVNIVLSKTWLAKSVQKMLLEGIHTWAPKLPVKRAVVDFSSPNIAKEMHVGHLRSTIIGDTLARMLEFSGVDVLRRNHVGDWGTQFGMLIEFLFAQFPQWEDDSEIPIQDLEVYAVRYLVCGDLNSEPQTSLPLCFSMGFYKQSKKRFDDDPDFKERAQKAVGGEPKYRKAWAKICEISHYHLVSRISPSLSPPFFLRGVILSVYQGESFYNPYIPRVLEELGSKGLIEESEGARVIKIEGKDIPLIVVKRDGGYNYASTDLAALWYRLNEEKAEWIIYVTDVGQREHFEMFFHAAKLAGWLPGDDIQYPRTSHVGFGLVLGEDGKRFRTRSSEVVRLVDLLDEAKNRSWQALIERGKDKEWTEEELLQTAEAVGYGAVKYADLKNNRLTNYTFNFDQMLSDKVPFVFLFVSLSFLFMVLWEASALQLLGNTAVYLLYAHARICSIIRKSGKSIDELKKGGEIVLAHPDERALGLHLLQFSEIVEEACNNLLPNVLCEYLYNLSEYFTKFYSNCQVVGSPEETSRLLLCEATAVVMRKCFHLLGITPVYKI